MTPPHQRGVRKEGPSSPAISLIVLHAPQDAPLAEDLERHLAVLVRSEEICVLPSDALTELTASTGPLESAEPTIVLLLLSKWFLADEDCWDVGTKAMEANLAHVHLVPIIGRPCRWQDTALGRLKALPENEVPVGSPHRDADEAWTQIVAAVRELVETLRLSSQGLGAADPQPTRHAAAFRLARNRLSARRPPHYPDHPMVRSVTKPRKYGTPPDEDDDEDGHTLLDRANVGELIILAGPPGCGKTTEMIRAAESLLDDESATVTPVLLDWSILRINEFSASLDHARAIVASELTGRPVSQAKAPALLSAFTKCRTVLVLMDGLDDVSSTARANILSIARQLACSHERVAIVAALRTGHLDLAQDMSTCFLMPVSPDVLRRFLDVRNEHELSDLFLSKESPLRNEALRTPYLVVAAIEAPMFARRAIGPLVVYVARQALTRCIRATRLVSNETDSSADEDENEETTVTAALAALREAAHQLAAHAEPSASLEAFDASISLGAAIGSKGSTWYSARNIRNICIRAQLLVRKRDRITFANDIVRNTFLALWIAERLSVDVSNDDRPDHPVPSTRMPRMIRQVAADRNWYVATIVFASFLKERELGSLVEAMSRRDRSLAIACAHAIGKVPVQLLDEIENGAERQSRRGLRLSTQNYIKAINLTLTASIAASFASSVLSMLAPNTPFLGVLNLVVVAIRALQLILLLPVLPLLVGTATCLGVVFEGDMLGAAVSVTSIGTVALLWAFGDQLDAALAQKFFLPAAGALFQAHTSTSRRKLQQIDIDSSGLGASPACRQVLHSLREIDKSEHGELFHLDPSEETQLLLVRTFGASSAAAAVHRLEPFLRSPHESVRMTAAQELIGIGASVGFLRQVIKNLINARLDETRWTPREHATLSSIYTRMGTASPSTHGVRQRVAQSLQPGDVAALPTSDRLTVALATSALHWVAIFAWGMLATIAVGMVYRISQQVPFLLLIASVALQKHAKGAGTRFSWSPVFVLQWILYKALGRVLLWVPRAGAFLGNKVAVLRVKGRNAAEQGASSRALSGADRQADAPNALPFVIPAMMVVAYLICCDFRSPLSSIDIRQAMRAGAVLPEGLSVTSTHRVMLSGFLHHDLIHLVVDVTACLVAGRIVTKWLGGWYVLSVVLGLNLVSTALILALWPAGSWFSIWDGRVVWEYVGDSRYGIGLILAVALCWIRNPNWRLSMKRELAPWIVGTLLACMTILVYYATRRPLFCLSAALTAYLGCVLHSGIRAESGLGVLPVRGARRWVKGVAIGCGAVSVFGFLMSFLVPMDWYERRTLAIRAEVALSAGRPNDAVEILAAGAGSLRSDAYLAGVNLVAVARAGGDTAAAASTYRQANSSGYVWYCSGLSTEIANVLQSESMSMPIDPDSARLVQDVAGCGWLMDLVCLHPYEGERATASDVAAIVAVEDRRIAELVARMKDDPAVFEKLRTVPRESKCSNLAQVAVMISALARSRY